MEGSFARDAHEMQEHRLCPSYRHGKASPPEGKKTSFGLLRGARGAVARGENDSAAVLPFPIVHVYLQHANPTSYLAGKTTTVFADSARVTDCLCLKPRDKQYVVLNPEPLTPNTIRTLNPASARAPKRMGTGIMRSSTSLRSSLSPSRTTQLICGTILITVNVPASSSSSSSSSSASSSSSSSPACSSTCSSTSSQQSHHAIHPHHTCHLIDNHDHSREHSLFFIVLNQRNHHPLPLPSVPSEHLQEWR